MTIVLSCLPRKILWSKLAFTLRLPIICDSSKSEVDNQKIATLCFFPLPALLWHWLTGICPPESAWELFEEYLGRIVVVDKVLAQYFWVITVWFPGTPLAVAAGLHGAAGVAHQQQHPDIEAVEQRRVITTRAKLVTLYRVSSPCIPTQNQLIPA